MGKNAENRVENEYLWHLYNNDGPNFFFQFGHK